MACTQTVGDSCRTLQTIQFRKESGQPSELADEMNYQCGDPATAEMVQYTAGCAPWSPPSSSTPCFSPPWCEALYDCCVPLLDSFGRQR